MTNFTKCEWCVSGVGDDTYIDSETGFTIATVLDMSPELANAHLIAAAPAMYAALLAMSKGEGLQSGTTIESILLKARGG